MPCCNCEPLPVKKYPLEVESYSDGRLRFCLQPEFFAFGKHKAEGFVVLVGDKPVEDGFTDGIFDDAYLAAGLQCESLHDGPLPNLLVQ